MEPCIQAGTVGFVARELERISVALGQPQSPERYAQLYAAQQALSWATDPQMFAAPFDSIYREPVVTEDTPAS